MKSKSILIILILCCMLLLPISKLHTNHIIKSYMYQNEQNETSATNKALFTSINKNTQIEDIMFIGNSDNITSWTNSGNLNIAYIPLNSGSMWKFEQCKYTIAGIIGWWCNSTDIDNRIIKESNQCISLLFNNQTGYDSMSKKCKIIDYKDNRSRIYYELK